MQLNHEIIIKGESVWIFKVSVSFTVTQLLVLYLGITSITKHRDAEL